MARAPSTRRSAPDDTYAERRELASHLGGTALMAGPGGPGTVIVPWYATGFRADSFGAALNEIAPVALRYGASSYAVYRYRDDRYKFQQLAAFEDLLDWERYWEGPEMTDFRVITSGWCQVPVLYGWWDLTAGGALVSGEAPDGNGHGDGRGNGWGRRVASGQRTRAN